MIEKMRKFIHIDMDCFYAAVEMRDNPDLRGIPIAIGGSADRRGVIATCNYPARKFGVRSAMSTAAALNLCPHLTLVKGRMEVYREVSGKIREIFERYTTLIEPLSLDEAFLDVTDSSLFQGSATLIAEDIRQAIYKETGLTASAGVAPIKFVAKVASDENKPDGICVIVPEKLDEFVKRLPLKKVPGVGKVTLQKLNAMGLQTCEDVRASSQARIFKKFGKFGHSLWNRCHAIDERMLNTNRIRKSVGVETTLDKDLSSIEECLQIVDKLYPKLIKRLSKNGEVRAIKSQGVKLKFSDFRQTTVEHQQPTLNRDYFVELLAAAFARRAGKGIRLVGVQVTLSQQDNKEQLTLPFV